MNAEEFRDALSEAGLSVTGAARLFGRSRRTVQRWASGEDPIPPAEAMCVACWSNHLIGPNDARKLAGLQMLDHISRSRGAPRVPAEVISA